MSNRETTEIMRRFNDAFQRHDPSAFAELIADDCVIENTHPAPDGARIVGGEACVKHWSAIATSLEIAFDLEDVIVADDRAIVLWRMRRGERAEDSIRGVNLMRVRDGKIVEGMGYVKGR